jgi:hypothetical protein
VKGIVMEWNEQEYETTLRQFRPRNPRLPEALIARPQRRRLWIGAAVAVILVGLLLIPIVRNLRGDVYAVVEAADDSLVRVIGVETQPVAAGGTINVGDVLRSEGESSAVLALRDGLRFEMRSKSEFRLERADDGIRIYLLQGSVIIHAPTQAAGRLYVRTTDLSVSAVSMSTVFLISSEFERTRVAVLAGQVRVQQGALSKVLRPGEQLSTYPGLKSLSISDEISWSREAETHLRLLQPDLPEHQEAFEVASLRPGKPQPTASPCDGAVEVVSRRFSARGVTLYQLILIAYDKGDCALALKADILSGGPEWIKSYSFDVEALMPVGNLTPALPGMLRSMLQDRFRLSLLPQLREMPVYVLAVEKSGHKIPGEQGVAKGPMADLASQLARVLQRPVLDRTDIKGDVPIGRLLARLELETRFNPEAFSLSSVQRELAEFGLTLEPANELVEVLTVRNAENPESGPRDNGMK